MKKLLPPHLAIICLMAMLALAFLAPQPFAQELVLRLVGGAVALFGLVISISAKKQFQKAETNVNTFERPDVLITSGRFRISRNPMYLGLLLVLLGVAVLIGNLFTFLGPLIFFLAAACWYIPFEEEAAEEMFGSAYLEYCETVRRWL